MIFTKDGKPPAPDTILRIAPPTWGVLHSGVLVLPYYGMGMDERPDSLYCMEAGPV